jgi:L-aminopeptidase/D-esterase-like protein
VNDTITAIAGVEVGHWSDFEAETGCTVVVFPEPNVAAAEVRGAAPGSRETALLEHGMRIEQIQAILLTGGSAFGLAAADGVVRALEADGRGHPTAVARVPIVPAAVVFDLRPEGGVRPGADQGEAAYRAATTDPVEAGRVGAGTGTTVAKWRGFEHMQPGGLGSATRRVGESTVGALVVLNAVGDVFTVSGESLTGGDHEPGPPAPFPEPMANTTLVVLATDAALTRSALSRLAVRSQDAVAVCIRPAHTRFDGDIVFAVSCGPLDEDVEALGEAAFGATAAAVERAVRAARGEKPGS